MAYFTLPTSGTGITQLTGDGVSGPGAGSQVLTITGLAYSKLNLTGSIVNADINAAAAIAYSKLALTGAVQNADLAGSIAYSKLSLTGAVLATDLAGSIPDSKLSTIATAGKILDSALPASMATKTFTGVTSFPGSSSIDGSGNASFSGTVKANATINTGGAFSFVAGSAGYLGGSSSAVFNSLGTSYFASTGQLGFSVGQAGVTTDPTTVVMLLNTSGNVGIGAAANGQGRLDITAPINIDGLTLRNSGAHSFLSHYPQSGSNVYYDTRTVGSPTLFRTSNAGTTDTLAMYIAPVGSVSLGTTNGSYGKLTVFNSSAVSSIVMSDVTLGVSYGGIVRGYGTTGLGGFAELGVLDNGTYTQGILIAQAADHISFSTSGIAGASVERMRIDSTGKVGIAGKVTTGSDISISGGSVVSAGAGTNNPAVMIRNTATSTIIATNVTATWTFPTFIGGIIMVTDTTDAFAGLFFISGNGGIVKVSDPAGGFTTTINNAATVNVTYVGSTGVLSVQNKLAATKGFLVTLLASS